MEEQGQIVSTFFNKLDPDFDADAIEQLEDHVVQQRRMAPEVHGLMPSEGHGFCRRPHGYPVSRDWANVDCRATGCRWNRLEKCMVPSRCKIGADGKCGGFEVPPAVTQVDGD